MKNFIKTIILNTTLQGKQKLKRKNPVLAVTNWQKDIEFF
jgi:hypothetical protein